MTPTDDSKRIAPIRLLGLPTALVVDVREHGVPGAAPFPNVLRLPMSELSDRLLELPSDTLYIVCEWGSKSSRVASYLTGLGFDAVVVDGGLAAVDDEGVSSGVPAL